MIYSDEKKAFDYRGLHVMMYAKKEVKKHSVEVTIDTFIILVR